MKLFHSREDFSRLYSKMGFTRVSLSETQHFHMFSRMDLNSFFTLLEVNTSFPHSLLISGTNHFILILQNK